MSYIDGFVAAVPAAKKDEWKAFVEKWAPTFIGYGAKRIVENWGDDVPHGRQTDFHRAVQANADETVCFSWIEWPSKAARDAGMQKVMADPAMGAAQLPFDGRRMIIGGFAPVLDTATMPHCAAPAAAAPIKDRTLTLERVLDAPAAALWRCWTEPALLEQWFCPKPWRVSDAAIDLRVGGVFSSTMHGPEGETVRNAGQLVAVEPQRRLVFTDAFVGDFIPSGKAFMVGDVRFEARGGKTLYTAQALHWSQDDADAHAAMGFEQGWGVCADQLEALAKTL